MGLLFSNFIDQHIQYGNSIAASKLGFLYNVFRNNTQIATDIYLYPVRLTVKSQIEAAVSLKDIVWMNLIADCTNYVQGDVFVHSASNPNGANPEERYVLGFKRPAKPNEGYRCEIPITLIRPYQAPAANDTNIAPYGGQRGLTNSILSYDGTNYSFLAPAIFNQNTFDDNSRQAVITPATVYASKFRTGYAGPNNSMRTPLDVKESQWIFVMELLPGLQLRINDEIQYQNDVYQVTAVDNQAAGFHGQLVYTNLKRP